MKTSQAIRAVHRVNQPTTACCLADGIDGKQQLDNQTDWIILRLFVGTSYLIIFLFFSIFSPIGWEKIQRKLTAHVVSIYLYYCTCNPGLQLLAHLSVPASQSISTVRSGSCLYWRSPLLLQQRKLPWNTDAVETATRKYRFPCHWPYEQPLWFFLLSYPYFPASLQVGWRAGVHMYMQSIYRLHVSPSYVLRSPSHSQKNTLLYSRLYSQSMCVSCLLIYLWPQRKLVSLRRYRRAR